MKSPTVIEAVSVPFSGSVFASWPCSSVLDAHVWWCVLHWRGLPLGACSVYLGVWWQQTRSCCPGLVYVAHLFSYLFTFHLFISLYSDCIPWSLALFRLVRKLHILIGMFSPFTFNKNITGMDGCKTTILICLLFILVFFLYCVLLG